MHRIFLKAHARALSVLEVKDDEGADCSDALAAEGDAEASGTHCSEQASELTCFKIRERMDGQSA